MGCSPPCGFESHAAVPGYYGPTSDPSKLVQNLDGSWTRTFPDGTVVQFNNAGSETSSTDRNGNATTYTYIAPGNPGAGALKTITDPVGLVTTFAYDSFGHLETITDPASRVTTLTVDSNDNLTEIVDPDGATTQYGYSTPSNHEATSETDPNNNTATAHYNAFGQLTSETLFDGTSTTSIDPEQSNVACWRWRATGTMPLSLANQGSVTDPDGRTTTIAMNFMAHPTGQSDATGATTHATYSNKGFLSTETDALGQTTKYIFDDNGNLTSITIPPSSSGGSSSTETLTYGDAFGVPTSISRTSTVTRRRTRARRPRQHPRGGRSRRSGLGMDLQLGRPGSHRNRPEREHDDVRL